MNRNRTDKMGMQKKHDHESGFFEDNNLPDEKHKRMINHFTNHSNSARENSSRQKRSFIDDKSASTSASKMRRTDDGPAQSDRSHQNNTVKSSKEVSKIVMDEQKCKKIESVGSNSSDVILIKDNISDSDRKKCSDESSSANHSNKKSRREREENDTYLRELEVASTIRNQSQNSANVAVLNPIGDLRAYVPIEPSQNKTTRTSNRDSTNAPRNIGYLALKQLRNLPINDAFVRK